jgi:hypothetical protein
MLNEEREIEPDHHEPEGDHAQAFVEHAAAHLGEPVEPAGEQGEDRSPEQHVVEVGDDEIGVGQLPVDRGDGEHHARQPADHELQEEGDREAH